MGKTEVQTKLRWAREAAEGLRYIQSKNITHADVSCYNLLLDQSGHTKFIDFAGSDTDGEAATVCYEWGSYRPGSEPYIKQISLHSAQLFEIEPSEKPYQELAKTLALDIGNLTRRVEDLFAMGKYPGVDMLVLGEVILLEGIMPLNGRCFEGHRRMLPGYL